MDPGERVAEAIGRYEVSLRGSNLDCREGDLGEAYKRGWNAAVDKIAAAFRKLGGGAL